MEKARSFGLDASRYDRARPSYPAVLIADLIAERMGLRVLDVGCGTGKAGRLFADAGCHVLGVEPDERMAAVARAHELAVEVDAFEDWDPAGRQFDLVVSGQAWHWTDQGQAIPKAAQVLFDGGALGLFWNVGHHEPGMHAAMLQLYGRLAPELLPKPLELHTLPPQRAADAEALRASGLFGAVDVATYEWDAVYSRDEWLDQLGTHSDHIALDDRDREAVLDAVGDVVDARGGVVPMHYETWLIRAVKA